MVAGQGCVEHVVGENRMGGASVKGNDIIQLWLPQIGAALKPSTGPPGGAWQNSLKGS